MILQHVEMTAVPTVDPGGEESMIIQQADMNAVPTVDLVAGGEVDTDMMGNVELIIAHVEMLMDHEELKEVSTVELGGEAVATENMQHAEKIYMEHAIQQAEMLLQQRAVDASSGERSSRKRF